MLFTVHNPPDLRLNTKKRRQRFDFHPSESEINQTEKTEHCVWSQQGEDVGVQE